MLSRERGWPDAGEDKQKGLRFLQVEEGLTKSGDKRVVVFENRDPCPQDREELIFLQGLQAGWRAIVCGTSLRGTVSV